MSSVAIHFIRLSSYKIQLSTRPLFLPLYLMQVFFNTRKAFEYTLNGVIKTPLPLHNHISHGSLPMLWMAMWESSLSMQTKWLIAPFCIDTVIIITPAMMEIKAPLLSWFCGFVLWRPCQLFLVWRQYLLITGDTRWAITPCSEEKRVALKWIASWIFFLFFFFSWANALLSRLVTKENQV